MPPPSFQATFLGPTGPYRAVYLPDDRDGMVDVFLGEANLRWSVDFVEDVGGGSFKLCGLSSGSDTMWGDTYWFVLHTGVPVHLDYWGDQVLVRTDELAELEP